MAFTSKTTHHTPRYISWTYSKLKAWRNCPRQHLHKDIEKLYKSEDENSEHLAFGKLVHKHMEDRILLGPSAVIPAHIQALLKGNMEAWAKRVLNGFHDAGDFAKATNGILKGEQQLAIDENFKPCAWFDKQVNPWARAQVDVTKILGPVAFLIDWKTGKVTQREEDQLLISAAMIFLHYPQVQSIRTMYVWLKEDAETTLDVHRNQMPEFWATILPDINAYRKAVAAMDMPPRPSGLCGWCPVRKCEHHPEYRG